MRRIVDLSAPLADGVRGLATEPCTTIGVEGYNTTTLHLYTHAATHMDAPLHFVDGGGTIDQVDLAVCCGPAEVLDLTPVAPDALLEVADLEPHAARVTPGSRLLLRTDWSQRLGTAAYRDDLPRVSAGLAAWLVARGVALLGVEPPSVASVRPERRDELTRVHRILLEGGVVIVEGLCQLDQLRQARVEFVALPLKLRGLDGSPVRAVAFEDDAAGPSAP